MSPNILGIALKLLLVLSLAGFQGCSTIPAESIELSRDIGSGITESKRSYDALATAFFADKRQQVISWARGEYLETLLRNIATQPGAPQTFTPAQLRDILDVVLKEQQAKLSDLDRTRALVQSKSDEHYALLSQANASVTGLLQSAVKVTESKSAAFKSIKEQSAGKVDLAELEGKFDEYLRKAGAASDKATSFIEAAKSLTNK